MEFQNSIEIDGNGNITIQDVANGSITIHTNHEADILRQLKKLNTTQIDSLLQVAEKQKQIFSELFIILLNGVAKEKNVVRGNISNVQTVRIGDETHYHYAETKLSKELTLNIPKTHPSDIVGREQDLEQLHNLLSTEKRVVVVNGLGGIGKTTLAQVYVSKYYDEYHHITWITQNSENIANDFINANGLIKNLGVETTNAEPEQIFEEIIRKLKSIADKPNLLIIDNAEQSLKKFRDTLPGQPLWHLLVTSRVGITGFHIQPLGFLSEEQAIAFFKKYYTHQRLKEQDIKELVGTVDYHTLTIEILAKTAAVQRYDAATLKQAIENDLRANIEVSHNRHSSRIEKVGTYLQTVFNLSRLTKNEIWLMKQLACLPAEFHSYDLLHEMIVYDQKRYAVIFSETLEGITQKGLLLQNKENDSYKMHRIIAEVVKKAQKISTTDIKGLLATITQKLHIDNISDNPVDKFAWIPYGKALLANFSSNTSYEIGKLQNNLALMLKVLGDYQSAKSHLQKAVIIMEKNFGKDHPDTIVSYSNLATVLQDLGDYKGAKSLLEKAVKLAEKNFGKGHPRTAVRYSNLALVLQHLGDYHGAISLLEKAIVSDEKNFGKYHPTTVSRYSDLALMLQDLGNYQGAKLLLEKVVIFSENTFGKDHPTTVVRYSNLAGLLQDLGDYQGAKLLLEKVVISSEKTFGKDHPTTALRYSRLATVFQNLGDNHEALKLSEMALAILKRVLPEGHPHIQTANKIFQSIKNTN